MICIVRPLADPQAKSEIFVLDRVSPDFMKHLANEREARPAAAYVAGITAHPIADGTGTEI